MHYSSQPPYPTAIGVEVNSCVSSEGEHVSHSEESRRNITVRGMEDVHDARFCGVKVSARVRRESCTRPNMLLSFNLEFKLQFKLQLLHTHGSV